MSHFCNIFNPKNEKNTKKWKKSEKRMFLDILTCNFLFNFFKNVQFWTPKNTFYKEKSIKNEKNFTRKRKCWFLFGFFIQIFKGHKKSNQKAKVEDTKSPYFVQISSCDNRGQGGVELDFKFRISKCWPDEDKNYLLLMFTSILEEHVFEAYPYPQYSRRYD